MTGVKEPSVSAALIGDVVRSRGSGDRGVLHRRLEDALAAVNADPHVGVAGSLRITVGDEFQGTFAHVGAALAAAWSLRWRLADLAELRFGIGWGEVTVLDPRTQIEDGPGWWAARAAVEAAKAAASTPGQRLSRTAYRVAEETPGPSPDAVNAALLCRDHLVGSLSDRSRRILGGLAAGQSQTAIAEAEGVSVSAISQRVRRDGLVVVVEAQRRLEEVR